MSIPMTNAEKQEMLSELLDIVKRKTRDQFPQPNITAAELAALEGISGSEAYGQLEAAVLRGELQKEGNIHIDGMRRNIYWKV